MGGTARQTIRSVRSCPFCCCACRVSSRAYRISLRMAWMFGFVMVKVIGDTTSHKREGGCRNCALIPLDAHRVPSINSARTKRDKWFSEKNK
jgi:hypothetical protein